MKPDSDDSSFRIPPSREITHGTKLLRGHVCTLDPAAPVGQEVLVRGGRVVDVGQRGEISPHIDSSVEIIELDGVAVPGLIDSHVHALELGMRERRLSLEGTRSLAEVLDRVAVFAASRTDPWIRGGGNWDPRQLAEGRPPTAEELDRASGGRPVLLDLHYHGAVASRAALASAGLLNRVDEPGCFVAHDDEGAPSGVVSGREGVLMLEAAAPPPSIEEKAYALAAATSLLRQVGVTSFVEPAADLSDIDVYRYVRRRGTCGMRVMVQPVLEPHRVEQDLDELRERGWRTGDGDDQIWLGPAKLFIDGAGSLGTALLHKPWPDGSPGQQLIEATELGRLVRRALGWGWHVAVHTVGGGAVDVALDAYLAAGWVPERPGPPAHLIHAYLDVSVESMRRASELGLPLAAQPALLERAADGITDRLGSDAVRGALDLRAWLDNGVTIAFGSDAPGPAHDPRHGMWLAATGRSRRSQTVDRARLTVEEVLDGYTGGGAAILGRSGRLGVVRPGAYGDLTLFDGDPLETPPDELNELQVLGTVIDGAFTGRTSAR